MLKEERSPRYISKSPGLAAGVGKPLFDLYLRLRLGARRAIPESLAIPCALCAGALLLAARFVAVAAKGVPADRLVCCASPPESPGGRRRWCNPRHTAAASPAAPSLHRAADTAAARAALVRLELGKLCFPKAQNIGCNRAQASDLADAKVKLIGDFRFLRCALLRKVSRHASYQAGRVTRPTVTAQKYRPARFPLVVFLVD